MAKLVPSLAEINNFTPALEAGERALMDALCSVLDDQWTIYVQPFLNGLQPDIIIFSENIGLGIFEVKDWNLNNYRVHADGTWEVYDGRNQRWHASKSRCPLRQVEKYKDNIIRYELPELDAESVLDSNVYGLVVPFVYFHQHTTKQINEKIGILQDRYQYTSVFGYEFLKSAKLKSLLSSRHLQKQSRFAEMMQKYQLQNRLRNSLAYPEHGRSDALDILFTLPKRHQELLPNKPGKRRVIGAAGSGKSMILVRKAVNAALADQKVLLVCFNITMVNYLNDLVRRLSRYKDRHQEQIGRRIYVRHFHRLFPNEKELKDEEIIDAQPFDVILIDEGQDFDRDWIEQLYTLAKDNAHIMFVEDDRQNIYGKDTSARRTVPGIIGRPNELKKSFRINPKIAQLANMLIDMSAQKFESGALESAQVQVQQELLPLPQPIWFDGEYDLVLESLSTEITRLANEAGTGAFADIVILVCTVEDGWKVCDMLDKLPRPYICSFESREENEKVRQSCPPDQLEMKLENLRRGRKVAFRMQTGRIKICTIYSFKGWELKRVLVFYHPTGDTQFQNRAALLYTAITRTQEYLTIFNAEPTLSRFGQQASNLGLLDLRQIASTINANAAVLMEAGTDER
jgi:hypothetical protein